MVGHQWGREKNKFKGGVKMKICIQISKKDLEMLQEIKKVTGLEKDSVVSMGILIIHQWLYRR
jgi:hypothetical protein